MVRPEDTTSTTSPGLRRAVRWVVVLAVAAVAIFLVMRLVVPLLPPLGDMDVSTESFAEFIRDAGAWGVAGSIGLMVVHTFIPFPAEFVAFANGLVYGPLWGTVITWVGAMLGAFVAFGLARWLGRPFIELAVPSRHRNKLDRWAARSGRQAVFVSRFFPIVSFNLVNFTAGLTTVGWLPFVLATGIGILPATVLMVFLGHGMSSVSWQAWTALAAGGILVWFVWHVVRARRQRGEES